MRTLSFSILMFISSVAIGQAIHSRETDMFSSDIEKNIFRLTLMAYDDGWPLTFSYEREIKKPFTVVLKAGPSFTVREFGPIDDPYQYCINVFASAEFRYYYNLRRRIRKEKKVRNFSGIYLSLEQNVRSGPIALINESRSEAVDASSGTFINIGYQKQFKQGYFNVFIGPKMNLTDLKQGIVSADTFHFGIALGIVLFE